MPIMPLLLLDWCLRHRFWFVCVYLSVLVSQKFVNTISCKQLVENFMKFAALMHLETKMIR